MCPLKIGLRQIRDRRSGRCKLVAQNLQKFPADKRAVVKLAIDLDGLSDKSMAHLELARQAALSLEDAPGSVKAMSSLDGAATKLENLIILGEELIQKGKKLASDSEYSSEIKKMNNAAQVSINEMTNAFQEIVSVLESESPNASQARNLRRILEKSQKSTAKTEDTAAFSVDAAVDNLGKIAAGAALVGGGALLANKYMEKRKRDKDIAAILSNEPTVPTKEQEFRKVVRERNAAVPGAMPGLHPDSVLPVYQPPQTQEQLKKAREVEAKERQRIKEEVRVDTEILEKKEKEFSKAKETYMRSLKLLVTKENELKTKVSELESKMENATNLSIQLSGEIPLITDIRKELDAASQNAQVQEKEKELKNAMKTTNANYANFMKLVDEMSRSIPPLEEEKILLDVSLQSTKSNYGYLLDLVRQNKELTKRLNKESLWTSISEKITGKLDVPEIPIATLGPLSVKIQKLNEKLRNLKQLNDMNRWGQQLQAATLPEQGIIGTVKSFFAPTPAPASAPVRTMPRLAPRTPDDIQFDSMISFLEGIINDSVIYAGDIEVGLRTIKEYLETGKVLYGGVSKVTVKTPDRIQKVKVEFDKFKGLKQKTPVTEKTRNALSDAQKHITGIENMKFW